MRGVTYLASAGVGLLLEAEARASDAGGLLRLLIEPAGSPARLLELAGLEYLLAATADDR